jgi:hypothetical protein
MPKKYKLKTKLPPAPSVLEEMIQREFLGFGESGPPSLLLNPFYDVDAEALEKPHEYMLRFMCNPDNFYFTCKYIFNIELAPFQLAILHNLWTYKYPMLIGSRGMSKSFLLGLYALLRAMINQGCKIIVVGAGFRQAKVVFDYCDTIASNAPVFRSLIGNSKPKRGADMYSFNIGESTIIAIPVGDGSKIRGQRAHYLIADEFAAMSEAIYENVISGFASTNLSPIEQAKYEARIRVLKREGYWSDEMGEQSGFSGNQSIISGTAYYDFNHFAKYWKRYKTFIESRGDVDYITSKIGISSDKLDKDFDYKDYCVMRIPVDVLPRGFMDDKHISRARLTTSSWDYSMEYGAIFALDSNNFYKRSLIESCVTTQPIQLPSGSVSFSAVIRGNPRYDYVFGVDPASESDNFSIALLELHSDHRRVVYCWTTTKQRFKEKQEKGLVNEHDFYGYVARKIRDLMRVFPCFRIALDSQGGGVAVEEALHDKDKLQEGELPIWPVIDDDDPKDTDNKAGLHILYLVNFSIAQWVREANHGMRKDFEDKVLLFPQMDTVSLAEAAVEDEILKRVYDTLEDCVMEIEDLKDELATIVHTQTPGTGRDHWDTPKIKLPGKKEGRLRKDRYTALLMANAVARKIQRHEEEPSYNASGGFVGSIPKQTGKLYDYGPEWFVKAANSLAKNYGTVVNKSPR